MPHCPQCGTDNHYTNASCTRCGCNLLAENAPSGKFPTAALVATESLTLVFTLVAATNGLRHTLLWIPLAVMVLVPIICIEVYAIRRSKRRKYFEALEEMNKKAAELEATRRAAETASEEDDIFEDEDQANDRGYPCQREFHALNAVARHTVTEVRRWQDGQLLPARESYRVPLRRRVITCEPDDRISLAKWMENLAGYAASTGIILSESELKGLVTAMASSRLILLDTPSPEAARHFLQMLSTFCNCTLHSTVISSDWQNTWDLMTLNPRKDGENGQHLTGVLCDLYLANDRPNEICMTLLEQTKAESLQDVLADLRPYFRDPTAKHTISMRRMPARESIRFFEGDRLVLPSNMWFFCSPASGSAVERQKMLSLGAVTVSLTLPDVEGGYREQTCIYAPIRVDHFLSMMDSAVEAHFPEEAVWRRADALIELLDSRLGIKVDNRDLLQLEKLSSAYLALSDNKDPLAALAYALSVQVMPRVWAKHTPEALAAAGVTEWMTKTFGESLPSCLHAPV